jgi:molecular chaperone DnaK (HSP70)
MGEPDHTSATTTNGTRSGAARRRRCWIGIDLGTSNSAAAVWDSKRGHAKWMRLAGRRGGLATPEGTKVGRLVPSALLFVTPEFLHSQLPQLTSLAKTKRGATQIKQLPDRLETFVEDWYDVSDIVCAGDSAKDNSSKVYAYVGEAAVHMKQALLDLVSIMSETNSSAAQNDIASAFCRGYKHLFSRHGEGRTAEHLSQVVGGLPVELGGDRDDPHWVVAIRPLQQLPGLLSSESTLPSRTLLLRAHVLAAVTLRALRTSANRYLARHVLHPRGKKLQVPAYDSNDNNQHDGLPDDGISIDACHAVIGVPVHFDQSQRQAVRLAAQLAGFLPHVEVTQPIDEQSSGISVLTESTAAAMSYGLLTATMDENGDAREAKTILVFDMGGGTTDITIAKLEAAEEGGANGNNGWSDPLRVMTAVGKPGLGGDAMDYALATHVVQQIETENDHSMPHLAGLQELLDKCKQAKEQLCGEEYQPSVPSDYHSDDHPSSSRHTKSGTATQSVDFSFQGRKIRISMTEFEQCIHPLLMQTEELVRSALQRYSSVHSQGDSSRSTITIHEVILVGGATRVPAVRSLLRRLFPPPIPPELCTSVHPMSAVATGCAVQAAVLSKCIPLHQVRSSMMLDTLPYSIGVLTTGSSTISGENGSQFFLKVLERDSALPARGLSTFQLASLHQKGVTIKVVEDVGHTGTAASSSIYQPIGEFTFLLHRLRPDQVTEIIENRGGIRTVDVYFEMRTSGAFVVSIIDDNDPEHWGKRERLMKQDEEKKISRTAENGTASTILRANKSSTLDRTSEDGAVWTFETVLLTILCVFLFVVYVAVKTYFADFNSAMGTPSSASWGVSEL